MKLVLLAVSLFLVACSAEGATQAAAPSDQATQSSKVLEITLGQFKELSAALSATKMGAISSTDLGLLKKTHEGDSRGDGTCSHWTDCSYQDGEGVHHYVSLGRMVLKVKPVMEPRWMAPWGIGEKRAREDVLDAANRAIAPAKFACTEDKCSVFSGNRTAYLEFDSNDRLYRVGIEDWQSR